MLKGNLPFPQQHPSERMFAIITKEFEPLSDDIPQNLKSVISKALAKQTNERYQTASEMHEDLEQVLRGENLLGRKQSQLPETVPLINSESPFQNKH